jgi:hypothetical protein
MVCVFRSVSLIEMNSSIWIEEINKRKKKRKSNGHQIRNFFSPKKKVCESSDKQKNALPKNNCDCFNKKRQNGKKKNRQLYSMFVYFSIATIHTESINKKKKMIKYLIYRVCNLLSLFKKRSGLNLSKQLFSRKFILNIT